MSPAGVTPRGASHSAGARSRVPLRAWEVALAAVCGSTVIAVATVQHVIVLGLPFNTLHSWYYLLPATVGSVFGFLLARVVAYRRAEAVAHQRASERELEIVRLNKALTATVETRTRQLRETENELIQAQKMDAVGKLATGIAHDLNNMLTAIAGTASLARDTLEPDCEALQLVTEIEEATERASALTSRLMIFSRRDDPKPRTVNLLSVCEDVLPLLRRLVGRMYDVRLSASSSVPDVVVDPRRVEQVLLNLVTNARDAMPDGGTIEITAKEVAREALRAAPDAMQGDCVAMLSVMDHGTGMDQQTQDRLFEPFFTTKPVGKGTGLGMVVVRRVVEESRGVLEVDSELGRGTRVSLFLPCAGDDRESAA